MTNMNFILTDKRFYVMHQHNINLEFGDAFYYNNDRKIES